MRDTSSYRPQPVCNSTACKLPSRTFLMHADSADNAAVTVGIALLESLNLFSITWYNQSILFWADRYARYLRSICFLLLASVLGI